MFKLKTGLPKMENKPKPPEIKIEKQEIHNYGMQWDKDQKLLNPIKEKEDFFQVPSDEEMMEILNPNYVY